MRIANIVKSLRKKKKLTQKELSELIDMNQSFIAHIENGKNLPSDDTAEKLIKALGLNESEFIDILEKERYELEKNKAEKNYYQKFSFDYSGKPVRQEALSKISNLLVTPNEIMEIEKLMLKTHVITKDFFGNYWAVKQSPEYGELIINNMKKNSHHVYLYPKNDELEVIAQELRMRYREFPNVKLYPVENLDSLFTLLKCREIALYNLEDYSDNFNFGFYIDFCGSSYKDDYDSVVHVTMESDLVKSTAELINKKIITSKYS